MKLAEVSSVVRANEFKAEIRILALPNRGLTVLLDICINDTLERPGFSMVNVAVLEDDQFAGLGTADIIAGIEDLVLKISDALRNCVPAGFVYSCPNRVFFLLVLGYKKKVSREPSGTRPPDFCFVMWTV
jgi:hypothetical protein